MMLASARFFKGSLMYSGGEPTKALAEMKEATQQYQATGTRNYLPYFQMRIAEVYLVLGDSKNARALLDVAEEGLLRTGEYWCYAEWLRLSGQYEKIVNADAQAERAYYQRSIADAESRGAMLWLFRTLLSLKASAVQAEEQQTIESKIQGLLHDCPELASSNFLTQVKIPLSEH